MVPDPNPLEFLYRCCTRKYFKYLRSRTVITVILHSYNPLSHYKISLVCRSLLIATLFSGQFGDFTSNR